MASFLTKLRAMPNLIDLGLAKFQEQQISNKAFGRYTLIVFASLGKLVSRVGVLVLRLLNLCNPCGKEGKWVTAKDFKNRIELLKMTLERLPLGLIIFLKSLGLWVADKVTWGSWHDAVEEDLQAIAEAKREMAEYECELDIHIPQPDDVILTVDGPADTDSDSDTE